MIAPPPLPPPLQSASDTEDVVTAPQWLRNPSAEAIRRALPLAAAEDGVGGQAGIVCEIEPDTTLTHCTSGDQKNGYGFNAAALSLAPLFRIRPGTRNGEPIRRGRVFIPVRFDPPAEAALPIRPPWTGAPSAFEVKAALAVKRGASAPSGRGVMRCTVSGEQLTDCRPAADPADPLALAAVKLAPRFTIADRFANGRPTDKLIFDIAVTFDPPNAKPPASKPNEPPAWVRTPTPDQIAAAYPQGVAAQAAGRIEVDATCKVQPDGGLGGCRVTREAPVGVGGAEAAIRLANAYQTTAWSLDGRPTAGALVSLAFELKAPHDVQPPVKPAKRPQPRR